MKNEERLEATAGLCNGHAASQYQAFRANGARIDCVVAVWNDGSAWQVSAIAGSIGAVSDFACVVEIVADRESWAGGSNTGAGALEKWAAAYSRRFWSKEIRQS